MEVQEDGAKAFGGENELKEKERRLLIWNAC